MDNENLNPYIMNAYKFVLEESAIMLLWCDAGYDFELHDTQEKFVKGLGSTTKTCYFEVKGTSASFDEAHTQFYISQNEFETCEAIANDARRREQEAYFIVIIENCLD